MVVQPVDCAELKIRYDQVVSNRSTVEAVWRDIETYFAPLDGTGGGAVDSEAAIDWTRPDVWDSTAIDSSEKLSASIHGSVTSPALRWYGLKWREKELRDDQESCVWLDELAESSWNALQDSDFNTEIASSHQSLVRYGNAFVVEEVADERRWRGLDFESVPLEEGFFEADSRGGIETFYRRLSWTPVQIASECRKRGWEIPTDIAEETKQGKNLDKRYTVVFCIFPRYDAQKEIEQRIERNRARAAQRAKKAEAEQRKQSAGGMDEAGEPVEVEELAEEPLGADEPVNPLAPHIRPFGYTYFLHDKAVQLGKEGGYYEMPVALARWAKKSGSAWGYGQCHVLLPTVKYLNGWMETEHMAAAKAVDPSIGVTERGLMSDPDFTPGGITQFREKDSMWVIESKANPAWAQTKIGELRIMVQRGLHGDELTLKDSPAMTAMEVRARYELMNRVLGSTLARIENDLLGPIIRITIGHLLRAGQVPPMPDLVRRKYEAGDLDLNIEYQGPLARSQRTDEVAAIERVISFAAAMLKMGLPAEIVMATIDVVEAIRAVAERLGTPASLIKPSEDAKKVIDAYYQMQARAADAAAKKTESEAMANQGYAMAQARGPAGAAPGPVPAQPTPVVTPAYGPASPFVQPSPSM